MVAGHLVAVLGGDVVDETLQLGRFYVYQLSATGAL